jgi:hypothetical protein
MNILSTLNKLCSAYQTSNTNQSDNIPSTATSTPTTSFSEEVSELANSNQAEQIANQPGDINPQQFVKQLNSDHLKRELARLKALEETIQSNGGSISIQQASSVTTSQNSNSANNGQCSSGGNKGQHMLQRLDADKNGQITLQEVQAKEAQITNLLNQQQTPQTSTV